MIYINETDTHYDVGCYYGMKLLENLGNVEPYYHFTSQQQSNIKHIMVHIVWNFRSQS